MLFPWSSNESCSPRQSVSPYHWLTWWVSVLHNGHCGSPGRTQVKVLCVAIVRLPGFPHLLLFLLNSIHLCLWGWVFNHTTFLQGNTLSFSLGKTAVIHLLGWTVNQSCRMPICETWISHYTCLNRSVLPIFFVSGRVEAGPDTSPPSPDTLQMESCPLLLLTRTVEDHHRSLLPISTTLLLCLLHTALSFVCVKSFGQEKDCITPLS